MNTISPSNSKKRVLIVDDDRDFSAAIGEILDSEGYEVQMAHNAVDAVALASDYDAHVALLDIRLGRDSGIELISELQCVREGILCVMMTGHAALETAIQALQQGAYNYLRKPVDGTDLLATLERCFEKILLTEDKDDAESQLSIRNRELEALTVRLRNIVESVKRLTATGDLDHLLPLLLHEVIHDIGADRGGLFMYRNGLMVETHSTADDGHEAEIDAYALAELLGRRKPLVFGQDTEFQPDSMQGNGTESILMLPLFGEADSIVGTIVLYRALDKPFSAQDCDLSSLLSSVCSEILRGTEAAEAVAAGEQRYRLLADNVADIIWTIDMDGTPTYVSPSVREICEYTVEEAMGQSLEARMAEESAAAVRNLLARIKSSPTSFSLNPPANLELELLQKSRQALATETGFTVLWDDAGKPTGLLGVSRDISERKRAEEARSRLAAAVECAAESIMITDPEGTIQYVNPAFERLTGYTRSEAIGFTPRILKSGKHDDAFYHNLWSTLRDSGLWTGRFINKTKNDQLREEEATISAIRDSRGKTINFVSVARDVTHEVELEHQLRQAQKMEAIGTLAGGIAHDFNNMLSPILGYAELAMSEVDPDSELYFSLSEISSAGRRASELVQQILAFGRRSDQEQKPVRVSIILKEALRLLRGSLPSTIYIHQDIANCAPVLADPTQIHQVVMNLCTNAYHAMRENGGTLSVAMRKAVVGNENADLFMDIPQGDYIELRVSDTGHGMDGETIDRIFEPYFTTKKVGEGTGLGLATVHGIIQAHRGKIVVDSVLQKGTTFTIYLPIAPPEAIQECDTKAEGPHWRGTERIIVVDDEAAIVAMLKRGLENFGYQVRGFDNGNDALAVITEAPHDCDLLITDQTMPQLTGLDLARQAIAIRADLPVILATGFSDTVNEQIAKTAGIREFLLKPASPKAIAEHIRRILDEAKSSS